MREKDNATCIQTNPPHRQPHTHTHSITLRSADELAVAWAVPVDPLLRDRHDASAYKLEIRAADCHWCDVYVYMHVLCVKAGGWMA